MRCIGTPDGQEPSGLRSCCGPGSYLCSSAHLSPESEQEKSGSERISVCAAGRKDVWNGVYGGLTSGAALGLRLGRIPVGVGAAFVLAATSAAVDTTGGHLVGRGLVDDGATPPHAIYPYKA